MCYTKKPQNNPCTGNYLFVNRTNFAVKMAIAIRYYVHRNLILTLISYSGKVNTLEI